MGKYSCRWLCSGVNMATSSPIQLEVLSSRTGTNTFAIFNRYLILIIKIINSLRTSSLRHSGGGVKEEGELWVASQDFVLYRSRKWKINFFTNKGSGPQYGPQRKEGTQGDRRVLVLSVFEVRSLRVQDQEKKIEKVTKRLLKPSVLKHPSPNPLPPLV